MEDYVSSEARIFGGSRSAEAPTVPPPAEPPPPFELVNIGQRKVEERQEARACHGEYAIVP